MSLTTKAHWDTLPPKACPVCERVLPRREYSYRGGKCKACYRAHRIAKGTDSTTRSRTPWRRRRRAGVRRIRASTS
jgi:hypothetical protein